MLSTSLAEARRVKRQQANRNPFTTYFPPSQKFGKKKNSRNSLSPIPVWPKLHLFAVRNRPPLISSTIQPVRNTFLTTDFFNDLPTTIRATRPPLEPKKPSRSREFYICMTNCLTLSHYNPVCGTDHTTYHNVYKLECSNRCGARPSKCRKKPCRGWWCEAYRSDVVFSLLCFFFCTFRSSSPKARHLLIKHLWVPFRESLRFQLK